MENDIKIENDKKNINIVNVFKKNWLSWTILIISIFIISYPNLFMGYFTFFILLILAYFSHYYSHCYRNIFTIIHNYHHENNNFFSYFSQIILELSVGGIFLPFYYLEYDLFDIWIIVLFTFFYTTIHNINYGQLRVNDVHYKHHNNIFCNIGPDICDVIFSTKCETDTDVENTNHYIPNIIIVTMIIFLFKYICKNERICDNLIKLCVIILILFYIFLILSSIYLFYFNLS
jgi:hypothetical protein